MENQTDNGMGLEDQGPSRKKPSMTIIKALRLANGWSLVNMEKKGFNRFTFSHIEGGIQKTSRKNMISIADAFSVRPHFIFDQYGFALQFSPRDVLTLAMAKRRKVKI